jgi:hypothetical protein
MLLVRHGMVPHNMKSGIIKWVEEWVFEEEIMDDDPLFDDDNPFDDGFFTDGE